MIKINIEKQKKQMPLVNPKDIWNAEDGTVWQQYMNNDPQKWYLINVGIHEPLLILWYCDESNQFRVSSASFKDLKEYNSCVKFVKINADIKIDMIFKKDFDE